MINKAAADAYGQEMLDSEPAAAVGERSGESMQIGNFDGNPKIVTELEALIDYFRILGRPAVRRRERRLLQ